MSTQPPERFPALQDTLIAGLVEKLPAVEDGMSASQVNQWLHLAAGILALVYGSGPVGDGLPPASASAPVRDTRTGAPLSAERDERDLKDAKDPRDPRDAKGGRGRGEHAMAPMIRRALSQAKKPLGVMQILAQLEKHEDLSAWKQPAGVLRYVLERMQDVELAVEEEGYKYRLAT